MRLAKILGSFWLFDRADEPSRLPAPEPRDIHWFNLNLSSTSVFIRHILVGLTLLLLLSVWSVPVAALASLLSWDTIHDVAPRLAKLLGKRYVLSSSPRQ